MGAWKFSSNATFSSTEAPLDLTRQVVRKTNRLKIQYLYVCLIYRKPWLKFKVFTRYNSKQDPGDLGLKANLDPFGPTLTYLDKFGAIWSSFEPYGLIWCNFFWPESLRDFFLSSEVAFFSFFVPRGCVILLSSEVAFFLFCPERLRDFFCPKRLCDFFCQEIAWFFCSKGLHDFFSWEVAWFFCRKRLHVFLLS